MYVSSIILLYTSRNVKSQVTSFTVHTPKKMGSLFHHKLPFLENITVVNFFMARDFAPYMYTCTRINSSYH